jgi:ubiquinone/menaquinone biosynthesis C-methylase UbiE
MSASVPTPPPGASAFTGERFLPSCDGEIAYEHWHRYAFARRFVQGKRVLDAACGEGYGTSLLAAVAASAVGVDIDLSTIAQAQQKYGEGTRVRFVATSCTGLPLPSATFDVIVSFETIEHLSAEEQPDMLAEFARVLAPSGVLIMSSPNKRLYSDARGYKNPYHLQELYREEFARLLGRRFPVQRWYHQRMAYWSGIWPESEAKEESESASTSHELEAWIGDADNIVPYAAPEGMYFIVLAGRDAAALAVAPACVSLFSDADESEVKRVEANAREVLRLDALLQDYTDTIARQGEHVVHLETLVTERERLVVERDAAVTRHAEHIHHLERLVVERDRMIGERDRQLEEANVGRTEREAELARRAETIAGLGKRSAALESEKAQLDAALAAQERAIGYLQSFRGWVGWPWRRLRHWFVR